MKRSIKRSARSLPRLERAPSGVRGLDEITGGGLPRGRTTLVCGAAGCGKTLAAMEFLVRGIEEHGEAGVFVSFEETFDELAANFASLSFDLRALVARKKLVVDYVSVERHQIEETGEYDLEALFIRLGSAIDEVGASRVVLDSVETLFSGLSNAGILRAELRRLFRFLKDRGVTAVVTGERGEGTLTRHGLEEYVSDCVILLDNRVENQIATRRMRIVKYRGAAHGANEYPFLLDEKGLSVLPITSLNLDATVSSQRVSTGVPGLDDMLGKGYYRGSSILITGAAGTGKTSLAASFAQATCRSGERCLYLALEESQQQLSRNMRSIGIDLEPWSKKGLLQVSASRPSVFGLEMRLLRAHQLVEQFRPRAVIVDPVSSLLVPGMVRDTQAMLTRLIDFLKNKGITALMTSLTPGGPNAPEETEVEISSLIDTWVLVRDVESGGERNRAVAIVKSRGMAHSNQTREFLFTPRGIQVVAIARDASGVFTGSGRLARAHEDEERRAHLQRRQEALEAEIAAMRAAFAVEADGIDRAAGPVRGRNGAARRRRVP
jgi:circadian clock protein KaiC